MSETHCPICYTPLEVRDVTPCMDCGGVPHEIDHALTGVHDYAIYRIFGDLTLTLCDFCRADFGSYYPDFFGLPRNKSIEIGKMQLLETIDSIQITKDKFCPDCNSRLAFLKFVEQARELNAAANLENGGATP